MKRSILLFFVSIIFAFNSVAQPPDSFYLNTSNNATVKFTTDAIYFFSNSKFIKCDYTGNVIWSKTILNVWAWATYENSIYVLKSDSELVKVDTSGSIIWAKYIVPIPPWGIVATSDRVFLYSTQSWTGQIVALDTSGNFVNGTDNLITGIGGAGFLQESAFPSLLGGIWIRNFVDPGHGDNIIRTDQSGNIDTISSAPYFNIAEDDHIQDILPFADSTYLVIDNGANSFNKGNCGVFRINESGQILWQRIFESVTDTLFYVVDAGSDSSNNTYLIIYVNNDSTYSYVGMKLDSSGNIIFSKKWTSYPGSLSLFLNGNSYYSRMQLHNGYFYCPAKYGNQAAFMVFDTLLNACGIIDSSITLSEMQDADSMLFSNYITATSCSVVSTNEVITNAVSPTSASLCNVVNMTGTIDEEKINIFPNPFENSLRIQFLVTEKNLIQVFSSTGEKVFEAQTVSDKTFIDLSFLQKGVYFLELKSTRYCFNHKIVKI